MARTQRPMNDVSKRSCCSHYDNDAARIALQIVLDAFRFARRQSLSEPNYPGPHQRITSRTPRKGFAVPIITFMLLLETTPRTSRLENVSMNLHHLSPAKAGAFVKVVHVLCDEQKFIRTLCKIGNRLMR